MIGYLRGQVAHLEINSVIIDVNGVGYEVTCSSNTSQDLQGGMDSALWIYTHVREDHLTLFGFSSRVEKTLFESLIKVNGIGPKMAVTILSGASLDQIIDDIENEDVKALTRLPKVGKKTAEQMVLTLKGTLVMDTESTNEDPAAKDLVSALVNLGFKAPQVKDVVDDLDKQLSFEEQLRGALQVLKGS